MTERPILFSGPMVRAILEGRKSQTRRVVTFTSAGHVKEPGGHRRWHRDDPDARLACPYGQPGDKLWVRETWALPPSYRAAQHGGLSKRPGIGPLAFRSDYTHWVPWLGTKWRPSIFMPRWASRLTLTVTGVRVERLQEISEDDARAEGAMFHDGHGIGHSGWRHDYRAVFATARESFASGWDSINGKRAPWSSNPWVWVVEFAQEPAP